MLILQPEVSFTFICTIWSWLSLLCLLLLSQSAQRRTCSGIWAYVPACKFVYAWKCGGLTFASCQMSTQMLPHFPSWAGQGDTIRFKRKPCESSWSLLGSQTGESWMGTREPWMMCIANGAASWQPWAPAVLWRAAIPRHRDPPGGWARQAHVSYFWINGNCIKSPSLPFWVLELPSLETVCAKDTWDLWAGRSSVLLPFVSC